MDAFFAARQVTSASADRFVLGSSGLEDASEE